MNFLTGQQSVGKATIISNNEDYLKVVAMVSGTTESELLGVDELGSISTDSKAPPKGTRNITQCKHPYVAISEKLHDKKRKIAKDLTELSPFQPDQKCNYDHVEAPLTETRNIEQQEHSYLPVLEKSQDVTNKRISIAKDSTASSSSHFDKTHIYDKNAPYVPVSVKEVSIVQSLKHWKNPKVRVIGKFMALNYDNYILCCHGKDQEKICLNLDNLDQYPKHGDIVEAFGALYEEKFLSQNSTSSFSKSMSHLKLKVMLYRSPLDVLQYNRSLSMVKPYIPFFVEEPLKKPLPEKSHDITNKNRTSIAKDSMESSLSHFDQTWNYDKNAPYVPMDVEEVSVVQSLKHWTNPKVRVIGKFIALNFDNHVLCSLGKDCGKVCLNLDNLDQYPKHGDIVEAFGALYKKVCSQTSTNIFQKSVFQIKFKVMFFRSPIDVLGYNRSLSLVKPYIPLFVKRDVK